MYDLRRFALADMTECGAALRNLGMGATCMEEVADRIVQFLYTRLVDRRMGQNGCALVRFFKTHSYSELDSDLQSFARRSLGRAPSSAGMKCLTLLATAGDRAEWNARERSQRYRAIPLTGGQFSEQFPMFAQLFEELGVSLEVQGPPHYDLLMEGEAKADKVFYVGNAAGNPVVPAQEQFVIPFGIRSVVGFGGLLPSGHLFVIVLFSKVSISRETADLFRTLALSTKSAILPFDGRVFRAEGAATVSDVAAESQVRTLLEQRAQVETLEQLLTNQEQAVIAHFISRRQAQER
jgi:two-component system NtrC family sensor kinase